MHCCRHVRSCHDGHCYKNDNMNSSCNSNYSDISYNNKPICILISLEDLEVWINVELVYFNIRLTEAAVLQALTLLGTRSMPT